MQKVFEVPQTAYSKDFHLRELPHRLQVMAAEERGVKYCMPKYGFNILNI